MAEPDPKPIEIIQADCNAAADYLDTMHVSVRWDQGSIDGVRGGQGDGLSLVQAFAQHRLAHTVPREPTEAMLDACPLETNEQIARANWQAMWDAALKGENRGD